MLRSGLRPGEAYALVPEDVDLESEVIRVEKSLAENQPTRTGITSGCRKTARRLGMVEELMLIRARRVA